MPATKSGIERIRYWQGQTLRSGDFGDQLAHDASLRWWHNRAIHNSFGVIAGFSPYIDGEEVVVSCGLAYDCFGRELLSPEPLSIALPPEEPSVDSTWRLVVRSTSSTLMTPQPLEIVWLTAEPPHHPEQGVTVAIGSWSDGKFGLRTERQSRMETVARPNLAGGYTVHGKTDWRAWTLLDQPAGQGLPEGVEVTVDTSAGGFQRTPCYFAGLRGDPWVVVERTIFVVLGRIVDATPASFVFSLLAASVLTSSVELSVSSVVETASPAVQFARRQWSVCWLGIEDIHAGSAEESKS